MSEFENDKFEYYCEICGSCGEDGCCSHLICITNLISENKKCRYGKTYLREIIFNDKVLNTLINLVENLKKDDTYTKEQFIKEFDEEYNSIYNDVFNSEKENSV